MAEKLTRLEDKNCRSILIEMLGYMCYKLIIKIALKSMLITQIQFAKLFEPAHKHVELVLMLHGHFKHI